MLNRRTLLKTSAKLTLLAPIASLVHALPNADARLVLVILRGGLDGLAAVPPYGEGQYRRLRGSLALDTPGAANGSLKLDGLFGLHPALTNMHAMYRGGELSVINAVATPYRQRSHFDGQKVLEAGGITPSTSAGGWLNRALKVLASADGDQRSAIALADTVPLVLRGPFVVSSWAPSRLPDADEDTLERVRALYDAVDPDLAARLTEALNARTIAGAAGMDGRRGGARQLTSVTTAAARFLSSPDGPRMAVMDVGGWDTHANQGAAQGNLANRLGALDAGLANLKAELGSLWQHTSVAIVTEFGRTAAVNGTRGTDHGTAGCAFLAGGAVNGGRIITDWPGLAAGDLYQGRDLKATLDLRAVFKGLLADRFALSESALESTVFPGSETVQPLADL